VPGAGQGREPFSLGDEMSKIYLVNLYILLLFTLILPGCSGGEGSSQTVAGVAAAGAPLSGTVYLKDSSNPANEISVPIGVDGTFSFNLIRLKAPFLLKAIGSVNGNGLVLYSFAATAGVANINPLSHLAVTDAYGSDDLASLYSSPDTENMQAINNSLADSIRKIQKALQITLVQFGAADTNFISDIFVANHQGIDLFLDLISISSNNGNLTITDNTTNTTISDSSDNLLANQVVMTPSIPTIGSVCILPSTSLSSVPVKGTVSFTAVVIGTSDQQVTWSVLEANGGTISTSGVYSAPESPGLYHIKATRVANPEKTTTATVTVTAECTGSECGGTISGKGIDIEATNRGTDAIVELRIKATPSSDWVPIVLPYPLAVGKTWGARLPEFYDCTALFANGDVGGAGGYEGTIPMDKTVPRGRFSLSNVYWLDISNTDKVEKIKSVSISYDGKQSWGGNLILNALDPGVRATVPFAHVLEGDVKIEFTDGTLSILHIILRSFMPWGINIRNIAIQTKPALYIRNMPNSGFTITSLYAFSSSSTELDANLLEAPVSPGETTKIGLAAGSYNIKVVDSSGREYSRPNLFVTDYCKIDWGGDFYGVSCN
jgi:hypothetical protein